MQVPRRRCGKSVKRHPSRSCASSASVQGQQTASFPQKNTANKSDSVGPQRLLPRLGMPPIPGVLTEQELAPRHPLPHGPTADRPSGRLPSVLYTYSTYSTYLVGTSSPSLYLEEARGSPAGKSCTVLYIKRNGPLNVVPAISGIRTGSSWYVKRDCHVLQVRATQPQLRSKFTSDDHRPMGSDRPWSRRRSFLRAPSKLFEVFGAFGNRGASPEQPSAEDCNPRQWRNSFLLNLLKRRGWISWTARIYRSRIHRPFRCMQLPLPPRASHLAALVKITQ